jgi:hypothetical protein
LNKARSISESISGLLYLHEFKLGKFGINLADLVKKDPTDTEDPANVPDTTGTEVEPTDSVDDKNTEAGQTAEPKILKKPRKVFTNIRKIVDEIIKSYPNKDFKAVINDISNKYEIPPLRLVRLFMHRTGTLATELPDGYSYGEFAPSTDTSGGEEDM